MYINHRLNPGTEPIHKIFAYITTSSVLSATFSHRYFKFFKPHAITHHHMRAEDLQTPSVSLIGRSGCCFRSTGSLGDIGSALYHLNRGRNREGRGWVNDESETVATIHMIDTNNNVFIHHSSVSLTGCWIWGGSYHDLMFVSVKEKVNSGEKYHNKSPLGIL